MDQTNIGNKSLRRWYGGRTVPLQFRQNLIGWVLSGPTSGAVQNDQQQNNLVTTHVLKTATNPVDITNESLDGSLQRFWDLESLGVRPRSVYEEFEGRITFEND